MQITPDVQCTFGWNTLVVKTTVGGCRGYFFGMEIESSNDPASYGVSGGPLIQAAHSKMSISFSGAKLIDNTSPFVFNSSASLLKVRNSFINRFAAIFSKTAFFFCHDGMGVLFGLLVNLS